MASLVNLFSCNAPFGKNKYKGYERAIDINHIRSVESSRTSKVLQIKIPLQDSITFDYNKSLKDVRFVRLETNEQCKIKNIDKLVITVDRIIVADLGIAKSVFVFDRQGHYVSSIVSNKNVIDKKALISNILDVAYNFQRNEIILHDQSKAKSYIFDKDGNFRTTSKEYVYFAKFVNLKGTGEFAYFNSFGGNGHVPRLKNSSIYLGDSGTRIKYTAENAVPNMLTSANFEINDNLSIDNSADSLFYTPEFSDTVYQIYGKPLSVQPKLLVRFDGPNINDMVKKQHTKNAEGYVKLSNVEQFYGFRGEILCNSDAVYYITTYKKGRTGYFYSEKTNKVIGGNLVSNLLPTDSTQLDGYRYPLTTFNNYFVSILSSSDFGNRNKGLSSAKLSEIKKGIKPADNPILVFYKLKNF